MRILVVSSFYPPEFIGGAELIAHEQAKILRHHGHEVLVFAGTPAGATETRLDMEVFEEMPIRRIRLHRDPRTDLDFFNPAVNTAFKECLRAFRPDIIYSQNLLTLSAAIPALARELGIPVVQMLHDHWGFCAKNTLLRSGSTICTDFSGCRACRVFATPLPGPAYPIELRNDYIAHVMSGATLVTPSRYLANAYERAGRFSAPPLPIPYGIDIDRFGRCPPPPESGPVRFVFVGYLGTHKGIWSIAHAAMRLRERANIMIDFVGSGHEEPHLRRFLQKHKLEGLVHLVGKLPNNAIDGVLANAHALILPSIWPENQPITITEAMAAGRPVIGTRMGGIPEMIDDGVTGFLVPPANSRILADRIQQLADDEGLRTAMGQRARLRIAQWEIERQVRQLEALFADHVHCEQLPTDDVLVACTGEPFTSEARLALYALKAQSLGRRLRFVMYDWLQPSERSRVAALWVVGPRWDREAIAGAGAQSVPLVVPAEQHELVALCRQRKHALWYECAEEATLALAHFLEQPISPNSPPSARAGH